MDSAHGGGRRRHRVRVRPGDHRRALLHPTNCCDDHTVTGRCNAESDSRPVITATIAAGSVTPTNAQAEAAVGQPIILAVSSDVADSIHVHSIPEHVFEVQPRPAQRFEFTVDVPGSVDVELHDLNRTIVTIAVRP